MKNISLLIVNDHPVIREGFHKVLAQLEGVEVKASAASSYQLGKLLANDRPDLVLIDTKCHVPLQQLIAEARHVSPNQKIVLSTALPVAEERRLAERLETQGLVSVFDDAFGLREVLLAVASGQKAFRENAEIEDQVHRYREDKNGKLDHPLSPREVDVLCCVAQAMTAKEIANDLQISVKTVDRHKANIMNKLNMRSQIELARFAIRNGFVQA